MALLGTIAVKLNAITSSFEKDMKKSESRLESFAAASAKVAKRSGAAFAGLSAAVAVSINAYDKQIVAERQLAAAAMATGQALDIDKFKEFASSLQRVTTTGDEAIIKMGSLLTTFGANQDAVEGLMPRILDMASATGQSANMIAMAMGRAIASGQAALGRYGLSLSKVEQKLFQTGTKAERSALLIQKLGVFQGQAAIEASTAVGRFKQLTNSLGDVTETIGEVLDQPIAAFFLAMRKAVDGVSPTVRRVAGVALGISTAIAGITFAVSGLIAVLPLLKIAFMKALWPVLAPVLAISAALVGVIAAVGALKMAWDQNAEALAGVWRDFVSFVGSAWDTVAEGIKKSFKSVVEFAIKAIAFVERASPEETFARLQSFRADGGASAVAGVGQFASEFAGGVAGSFDMLKASFREGLKTFGILDDVMGVLGTKTEDAATAAGGAAGKTGELGKAAEKAKIDLTGLSDRLQALSGQQAAVFAGATSGDQLGMAVPTEKIDIAAQDAAQAQANMAETMQHVGQTAQGVVGAMGDAGSAMSGVITAFAQGGPIAGIVSAIGQVVIRTKAFGDISKMLNKTFGMLIESFEPIVAAFADLFSGISVFTDTIHAATQAALETGGALGILRFVFKVVGNIFRLVAMAIAGVINGVISIFQAILKGLSHIPGLGRLKDLAKRLEKSKVKVGGASDAEGEAESMFERFGVGVGDMADAAEDTSDKLRDVAASLTNVPQGFKVALSRFNAIAGEPLPGESGTPEVPNNIEQVVVAALDPQVLADELESIRRRRYFVDTGSPATTGGPLAVTTHAK